VVAALLVPATGLGGLATLVRPNTDELTLLEQPRVTLPLRPLDGTPLDFRDSSLALTAKGLLSDTDAPLGDLDDALRRARDRDILNLRLAPDVTREQLVAALKVLREQEVPSVRLVGQSEQALALDFTPPRPFGRSLVQLSGVRVLLPTERACDALRCEFGTLSEAGLKVGGDVLPVKTGSRGFDGGELGLERAIHLEVGELTKRQLAASR
jgi:hypothetical protein